MNNTSVLIAAVFAMGLMAPSSADAQTMSDADKQKLAENYTQADADGDTNLTSAEFDTLLRLNAEDRLGKAAQIVKFGRQAMAFGRIDADRNGIVTRQELQALAP